MATKVGFVIVFSLFQLVCGNVPVLLWESSKSDRVNTLPTCHRISTPDFQQYILKKVHGEQPVPLIAIFEEERLSIEDFSWQDSQGQGNFPQLKYITENAADLAFLPSVQDPIKAVNELSEYGYSLKTINTNKIVDLPDGCGKVLVFKLQEIESEEDRPNLLRSHDVKIAEAYSQLLSKCSHVIGILSGKQPSWVEPEEVTRLRRSTDDNTTSVTGPYTLYEDAQGNSMVYSSQSPKLYLDGKELPLQNASVIVTGDTSKPGIIKLNVKYANSYQFTFTFDNKTVGYWYLQSFELKNMTTSAPADSYYILRSSLDIYAPSEMSWHSGSPVIFKNTTNVGGTSSTRKVVFSDLQIEPFFYKPGSKSFSDAVDAVPFFTPAIWSGIFVTFLLALIFTWGISMIMDIRTMDQFDDPKGKTITVSATD